MPLEKLLRTLVKNYTEWMRKQLLEDHNDLHSLYAETFSHEIPFREKLPILHQITVRKLKALGIDHDIMDSLDQSLPGELQKTMESSEPGSKLVAVLMEGHEKDPVGFVWSKDNQFLFQSTDREALKAWDAHTKDVFCIDSKDSDHGLTIRTRKPETQDDWLWAINASLYDTPYWIDTPQEIAKTWSEEARAASLETRRQRKADQEAIAKVRRERSQPYPQAGLQKADEATHYVSQGSSVDYAKQVMASLPAKDLSNSDIDTIT